jgi:hypothetical protein
MHPHRARRRHPRNSPCLAHCDRTPVAADDAQVGVLLPGEQVLARAEAFGWRYEAADITFERRTLLFGGPVGFAVSGIASALGNRRARRQAEQLAAHQWRPLGQLAILATSQRLLVWWREAWWSVWYSSLIEVTHDETKSRLELHFSDASPYCLQGAGLEAVLTAARSQG